jgi:hypothetical protein
VAHPRLRLRAALSSSRLRRGRPGALNRDRVGRAVGGRGQLIPLDRDDMDRRLHHRPVTHRAGIRIVRADKQLLAQDPEIDRAARYDRKAGLAQPAAHARDIGAGSVGGIVMKVGDEKLDIVPSQFVARRQRDRGRARPFEVHAGAGLRPRPDPRHEAFRRRQLLDQMAGKEPGHLDAGEVRHRTVEIDRFPIGVERAMFADSPVDTVKIEVGPRRRHPILPVGQSAAASAQIEQVRAPGE